MQRRADTATTVDRCLPIFFPAVVTMRPEAVTGPVGHCHTDGNVHDVVHHDVPGGAGWWHRERSRTGRRDFRKAMPPMLGVGKTEVCIHDVRKGAPQGPS